jgi:RNA polymerase sigma factor (sigma-70 family)
MPAELPGKAGMSAGVPLDAEQIGKLYLEHCQSTVHYLVHRQGADQSTAQDVVSDMFERMLRAAAEGAPVMTTGSIDSFIITSAVNDLNKLRARLRQQISDSSDGVDPSQRSAPSILVAQEVLDKVRARWDALSEKEKTLLTLVDQDGLEIREAAKQLGLPYEVAYKTYQRAHRDLEEELGKHWSTYILPATSGAYKPQTREGMLKRIDELPREYRDVVRAILADGLEERDLAARLKLSPGTVRDRCETGLGYLMKKTGMSMDEIRTALQKPLGG